MVKIYFHFISADLEECDVKIAKSEVKSESFNVNVAAANYKGQNLAFVKRALQNLPDQKGSLKISI